MALNFQPEDLKAYFQGIKAEGRKVRVTLIAGGVTSLGPPGYVGRDFAIFGASDGHAGRVIPFSAILFVENES